MRKEYLPAILIYVASAIFFVASAVCLFLQSHHWATFLIFGVAVMLLASAKLVNIGKKLRDKGESNR